MKNFKHDLYQLPLEEQSTINFHISSIDVLEKSIQEHRDGIKAIHKRMLESANFQKGDLVTDGSRVYRVIRAELVEDWLYWQYEKRADDIKTPKNLYYVQYHLETLRKSDLEPSERDTYPVQHREYRLSTYTK